MTAFQEYLLTQGFCRFSLNASFKRLWPSSSTSQNYFYRNVSIPLVQPLPQKSSINNETPEQNEMILISEELELEKAWLFELRASLGSINLDLFWAKIWQGLCIEPWVSFNPGLNWDLVLGTLWIESEEGISIRRTKRKKYLTIPFNLLRGSPFEFVVNLYLTLVYDGFE